MQPLAALPLEVARGIRGIFTDIDDTLTAHGKLVPEAFDALWRLSRAGVRVVPVTGRPAGWCDLIARQWPIDGVIGENGALAFYEVEGKLERMMHPEVADPATRARLAEVERAVLQEVFGARVAKDQAFRLYDLAIDFREEEPDLGLDAAQRIAGVFTRLGARAKVSSIHVNGWFGDYDKLSMMRLFAKQRWSIDLDAERERFLYVGDSPNDEPAFAYFPHACGVANVRSFESTMKHLPSYVSEAAGGLGFAEIAAAILLRRWQRF